MRNVTLGEFRKMTAHLPDSSPLLVPSPDHNYRQAVVYIAAAVFDGDFISEDWEGADERSRRESIIVS